MGEHGGTKIGDIDLARAVIRHEAVDCFSGTEQEASAQPPQLVSCAGGTFWGRPGERWPVSADGEPLIPWLQVVCGEMTGLYGAFYKRKAVCFYLAPEFAGYEATSVPDGGDLVVREYGPSDELVPLARPKPLNGHAFHRVIWRRLADYPSLSKYHDLFDESVYDALRETKDFEYENRTGIKIGGWPTPVQQDQEYPGTYDLQIDMTENFTYADSGIGYLSRSGAQWHVRFECC